MQGILFWIRENWQFEQKLGKLLNIVDQIPLKAGRNFSDYRYFDLNDVSIIEKTNLLKTFQFWMGDW